MTARARRGLALAAVWALAALVYLPAFGVPFQFDDFARIAENRPLHEGHYGLALQWLGTARPLPGVTFILGYVLGGAEPFGYHLVNLLVHLLATWGVFALALALCRAPRLRDGAAARRPLATATVAALLFACHPLQTQAVTYIIQRYASMAALFYVWSVVWYVRARIRQAGGEPGRPGRAFAAAAVLAVCAVLSKENALSLPLALLLTEWAAFGRLPSRRALLRGAVVVVLLAAVPVLWKVATWRPMVPWRAVTLESVVEAVLQRHGAPAPASSPLAYLLTQATVVPRYLLLVVRPWGLNVDHDVAIVTAPTPQVFAAALALIALLCAGLLAVRRLPLIGYGVLWIFVALSVESSLLPITDVMMEHRMYLAMPGVALVAGGLFAAAVARAPRLAPAVAALALAVLALLTFARNQVWQSPLTLWLDAVEKSPAKARVHVNVGVAYHGVGRLDDAVRHYCRALRLDPNIGLAGDNLEIALEAQGKLDAVVARLVGSGARVDQSGMLIVEVDVAESYCPK